jgi:flavin reductase
MQDQDTAAAAIDLKLFRHVMGSFVTGLTVITTETRGELRGMTANAFMSGSLNPPLCVVCVALKAGMHGHLLEAGHFGVNILARGQEIYSGHFAGKPVEGLYIPTEKVGRTPLLKNAVSTIGAELAEQYPCGDHSLFVGRIFHLSHAEDREPLVIHLGRFNALMRESQPLPVASDVRFRSRAVGLRRAWQCHINVAVLDTHDNRP